jgi:hypothetical protein
MDRARHERREMLARGDRRTALVERPGNEPFDDEVTVGIDAQAANATGRFA